MNDNAHYEALSIRTGLLLCERHFRQLEERMRLVTTGVMGLAFPWAYCRGHRRSREHRRIAFKAHAAVCAAAQYWRNRGTWVCAEYTFTHPAVIRYRQEHPEWRPSR